MLVHMKGMLAFCEVHSVLSTCHCVPTSGTYATLGVFLGHEDVWCSSTLKFLERVSLDAKIGQTDSPRQSSLDNCTAWNA